MSISGYALLDSGDGERLERFGEKQLRRPSSLAVWEKRLSDAQWANADATYSHSRGWSFKKGAFEEWATSLPEAKLMLKLQRNGQIGFFPEHYSVTSFFDSHPVVENSSTTTVLNLFAYTGLATVIALGRGFSVTHVDIAKHALTWANENVAKNGLTGNKLRIIKEDAFAFMRREARRGVSYSYIIADPPSFTRQKETTDEGSNEQEGSELLKECISLVAPLLAPNGKALITSHQLALGTEALVNLAYDTFGDAAKVEPITLTLREAETPRTLRCSVGVEVVSSEGMRR